MGFTRQDHASQRNPANLVGYQQVAIADLTHTALTGTPNNVLLGSAGANPTQAEYEDDLKELAVKLNAVLAALRSAGIIVP